MSIKQSRIHNVALHLAALPLGSEFLVRAIASPDQRLRMGFAADAIAGSTILPSSIGPISRFNANGRWIVHRDQPKEPRFMLQYVWKWKEWAGRDTVEREVIKDRCRDCYPRTRVEPPGVELTLQSENPSTIISPRLHNAPEQYDRIRHIINLTLELFGECELVDLNQTSFVSPNVKRVNWRFLPPGETPWSEYISAIEGLVAARSPSEAAIIVDRLNTLRGHGPKEVYVGLGGFSDYVAYVFPEIDITVLECIRLDNAIYVFEGDWRRASMMSKAEIIRDGVHMARIIHATGWKSALMELMNGRRAARKR